jgi:hypothetical protein
LGAIAAIAVGTAVAARQRRRRRWNAYDTNEIRARLHERFERANDALDATSRVPHAQ